MSPLYKKDDSSLVSNYRLISLLSALSKVMEKLFVNIFLTFFFINMQLLVYNQVLYMATLPLTNLLIFTILFERFYMTVKKSWQFSAM